MKSARVQQMLNQKQHPSLRQAAIQSARSKPPCRCRSSSISAGDGHNSERQAYVETGQHSGEAKQTGRVEVQEGMNHPDERQRYFPFMWNISFF